MHASLLLGPTKSGKSRHILDRFLSGAGNMGLGTLLLVPKRGHSRRVKNELAKKGTAFFTEGILTLEDLAEKILLRAGDGSPHINDGQRIWLLRHILVELESEKKLRVLKGLSGNEGFLQNLAEFIKELKRAEIFDKKLKEGLRRKGPDPKDNEISEIYARYQRALVQHQSFDREGLLWRAKVLLDKDRVIKEGQVLLVDGFDSFTPTQLGFLHGLAKGMQEIVFTLTLEKDREGDRRFARVEETRQALHQCFSLKEQWLKTNGIASPSARNDRPESLRGVERRSNLPLKTIHSSQFESTEGGLNLVYYFHHFPDLRAEARWCASKIKEILFENPKSAGGIGVAVGNTSLYQEILVSEFQKHGLPYQMPMGKSLESSALCQFVLAFLRAQENPQLVNLLALLQSPLLATSLKNKGFPSGSWMARLFREGAISDLSGDWKSRLRWVLKENFGSYRLSPALKSLPDTFERVVSEFGGWKKTQTVSEHLKTLVEKLASWGIDAETLQTLDQDPAYTRCSQEGIPTLSEQWNELWKTLESYTVFQSNWHKKPPSLDLSELLSDIRLFLRQGKLSSPSKSAGVAILDVHELWGKSYETLFILGLNENIFPNASDPRGLHSVAERHRMIEAGLELTNNDPEIKQNHEAFLFYQAINAATGALFLSWHRANPESKECLPSPFFRDTLERIGNNGNTGHNPKYGDITRFSFSNRDCVPSISWGITPVLRPACPQDLLGLLMAESEKDTGLKKRWNDQSPEAEKRLRWLERCASLEETRDYQKQFSVADGQVQDPALLAEIDSHLGLGSTLSASRLTEYAKCPFRFYSRYALKIDPETESFGELTHRLRGTLVHDILFRLYREHFQRKGSAQVSAIFPEMKKKLPVITEELFQTLEKDYGILHPGMWSWEKDRTLRQMSDFIDHEEALFLANPQRRPAYFELAFGMSKKGLDQDRASTEKPLLLKAGTRSVKIRGKIDRVDLEEFPGGNGKPLQGYWVLDYKSGSARISKTDIRKGKDVQLPVYLLSTAQALKELGIDAFAAGASLYHTWPPKDRKSFHKKAKALAKGDIHDLEWEDILKSAQERIVSYAKGISEGRFTPTPFQGECVPFCEYRSICRYDQGRMERKVATS